MSERVDVMVYKRKKKKSEGENDQRRTRSEMAKPMERAVFFMAITKSSSPQMKALVEGEASGKMLCQLSALIRPFSPVQLSEGLDHKEKRSASWKKKKKERKKADLGDGKVDLEEIR